MSTDEDRLRGLFASIAPKYDAMNAILSFGLDRRWRERAVRLVDDGPKDILDVACGTGKLTRALARRFPAASVTGADLTPAMLAVARAQTPADGACHIRYLEDDAQILAHAPEASADLVTCAFGFRNFPEPRKALAAARRVLRRNGQLLVLEFFRPRPWSLARLAALWTAVPVFLFARRLSEAYRHLRRSMRTTRSVREFLQLAEEAGFRLAKQTFFPPCCTGLLLKTR